MTEDITHCPLCGEVLILKGTDWGFCDNCVVEIESETIETFKWIDDNLKQIFKLEK